VLASAAFTLGAVELALQIADYPPSVFSPWIRDRDTGYRYAPSLHTRMKRPKEYDVAFETNSLGMRDDEVGPKHGPRILMLGDSFASGYGIERGEMFADILERNLGVEIVDAAVGGYEIIHQARWFEAHGRELAPDLVVYVVYLGNDLSRNDEWRVDESGALVSLEREFPVRRAYEIKLLSLYKSFRYRRKIEEEQQRGDWVPKPDYLATAERELSDGAKKDYADVEQLLGRLRDDVRAGGAELFVVLVPYRTMVDRKERDRFSAMTAGLRGTLRSRCARPPHGGDSREARRRVLRPVAGLARALRRGRRPLVLPGRRPPQRARQRAGRASAHPGAGKPCRPARRRKELKKTSA
jgi:hypothetical protein